ncbi:MAG TPA: DUF4258 domain-containing protein [bacterium]|nr:DUF4258 domain-containing protein [bacterium]
MFELILNIMRARIRGREYVMPLHALEEMENDDLTIFDIESGVLSGKIVERQKDKVTAQWKYRIQGESLSGEEVEIIAKLGASGKLLIITVYLL